jgi:transcriptional/translational regulatory protein YebC/TACO1
VAEIRHLFTKYNGNLGESGSVGWIFQKCGEILISSSSLDEDTLMMTALDCGASDIQAEEGSYTIQTEFADLYNVKEGLEKAGVEISEASVTMIPQNTIKLEGKQADQLLKLFEALEEHDDVQNVYANFDIADEILEQFEG